MVILYHFWNRIGVFVISWWMVLLLLWDMTLKGWGLMLEWVSF